MQCSRNVVFAVGLSTMFLAGSGCSTQPSSSLRESLESARILWNSQGISSYAFTMQRACLCTVTRPVRITVQNNVVVDRRDTTTDLPIDPADAVDFPDFQGLFTFVESVLAQQPNLVGVTFDDGGRGFVQRLEVDFVFATIDDNLIITVTDFTDTP